LRAKRSNPVFEHGRKNNVAAKTIGREDWIASSLRASQRRIEFPRHCERSEAIQSLSTAGRTMSRQKRSAAKTELLRRCAPRNDAPSF
jgi:hypothetical protein